MTFDPVSIAHNLLLLLVILGFCQVWARFDRLVLGWGAILLFCIGQYGWALIAAWLWSAAERAHRRFMVEERAMGFYRGRWIE